ncbi:MAG: hypothetical protein ACTSPV_17075, partial [Candidatus Hodarchaeales archaeon]
TIDYMSGIAYSKDWVCAQKPALDFYIEYQIRMLLSILFAIVPVIFLMVFLGILIRTIKKEVMNKNKKVLKCILSSFIVLILIIVTTPMVAVVDIPYDKSIPLPSYSDGPIYYNFEINWASKYTSRNFSENYKTTLNMFGNISFYFYELYNVSLTGDPSSPATAELFPILSKSDEPSSPSSSPFPVLGLLYLPNQVDNRSWLDLIGNEINSFYPFKGYTPSADSSIKKVKWFVNATWVDLDVNTITYTSDTNGSIFKFSFDVNTGWLLEATLDVGADSSWVQGLDLNELVISRRFIYNQIEDPEKYYAVNSIIELVLILITVTLVALTLEYYHKHPSKNKSPNKFI